MCTISHAHCLEAHRLARYEKAMTCLDYCCRLQGTEEKVAAAGLEAAAAVVPVHAVIGMCLSLCKMLQSPGWNMQQC